MTPEEAADALRAGREAYELDQWADLYTILGPAVDAAVLPAEQQGEACFYVGEYCRHTGAWDAAVGYFEAAAASAPHDQKEKAAERLAEIRRLDAATDAAGDGITDPDSAAVLAAADDALARFAYDDALARYRSVYDAPVDLAHRHAAALGIARAEAYTNQFDDAASYARWVQAEGSSAQQADAATLLQWIADQQAAERAAGDGVGADEFRSIERAAKAAWEHGDYGEAARLYHAIVDDEHVPGNDRARNAGNAAMCYVALDDAATAKPLFEYCIAHGSGHMIEQAQHMIEVLVDVRVASETAKATGPVDADQ